MFQMLSAGKTSHVCPTATPAKPGPARTRHEMHETSNRNLFITISRCPLMLFEYHRSVAPKESLEQNAGQGTKLWCFCFFQRAWKPSEPQGITIPAQRPSRVSRRFPVECPLFPPGN